MQRLMWCVLLFTFSVTVQAKVVTKEVTYTADGLNLKGYLAYDDAVKKKRPGVLVVHEWWGQNEYIRKRARMLAELGYVALALDMYGEGKQAAHPEDASKFSSEVMKNLDVAEKRFMAGLTLLQQQAQTDKQQVAAIGYCFGGGVVLAMARRGVDLNGVASFHGSLGAGAPAASGKIKAKVLVLNGADDPFVKPEQIAAFKEEMTAAGVDYEFVNYPGAKHSFTNPGATENGKKFQLPLEYNAAVDKESWQKLQAFFQQIFK
jgi:dienelactone hydrolase